MHSYIMRPMDWRAQFDSELQKAEDARRKGNEGRARVCARRAAGVAAVEFFERQGSRLGRGNAMEALQSLLLLPSLAEDLILPLQHLLQQVNTEFKLPPEVDLVADARHVRAALLPD